MIIPGYKGMHVSVVFQIDCGYINHSAHEKQVPSINLAWVKSGQVRGLKLRVTQVVLSCESSGSVNLPLP